MPEMLEHYRVLLRAVARLAGTQKAGRLDDSVATAVSVRWSPGCSDGSHPL